jgi:hypothetical protein
VGFLQVDVRSAPAGGSWRRNDRDGSPTFIPHFDLIDCTHTFYHEQELAAFLMIFLCCTAALRVKYLGSHAARGDPSFDPAICHPRHLSPRLNQSIRSNKSFRTLIPARRQQTCHLTSASNPPGESHKTPFLNISAYHTCPRIRHPAPPSSSSSSHPSNQSPVQPRFSSYVSVPQSSAQALTLGPAEQFSSAYEEQPA